jgi:N-acetyl-anhydromuramyl-L-alanine amidase AmpD
VFCCCFNNKTGKIGMDVKKWLLEEHCAVRFGYLSIGDMVRRSGKKYLWSERDSETVDTVVIHYMSAIDINPLLPYEMEKIIGIFCDYGVSSHFIIDRDGICYQLVPEEKKAWHSGGSIMPEPDNRRNVNDFSVGIELLATDTSGFTRKQYETLILLCHHLEVRFRRKMNYVGHDQIAGEQAVTLGLRKDRKVDPGTMFDWDLLRKGLENKENTEH